MTETTMAAAFARAGRKGPKARLREYAVTALDDALGGAEASAPPADPDAPRRLKETAKMAIEVHDRDLDAARGLFLAELMQDGQALNALMGEAVYRRATDYLHQVFREEFAGKGVRVKQHERAKPGKRGGQASFDAHGASAAGGGGGQVGPVTQVRLAPAATSPTRRAAAIAVASGIFTRSIGSGTRKVGDVTRFDVIQIKRRGLIDNAIADGLLDLEWPDDQTPLSKFAAEDDVEAIFRRAYRAFDSLGIASGGAT